MYSGTAKSHPWHFARLTRVCVVERDVVYACSFANSMYRYIRGVQTTHPGEKYSGFTGIVHPRVSLLAYRNVYRSAKEETAQLSWYHTYAHTPSIAFNVLPDRESRANWERRASNGDTRALFVAGSCQRAWYALLPPVRLSLAPRVCVHGYTRTYTHTHTHTHTHICTRSLLDQASVRSRIICARNWYWPKSI